MINFSNVAVGDATVLWWVDRADSVLERLGERRWVLGGAEQSRAKRFRFDQDRRDYVAAHLLIRVAVAELTGGVWTDIELRQECDRCHGVDHGRPRVSGAEAGPEVSWSHSRGWVAVAAARVPIGVDVEPVRSHRAGLDSWVRTEALVKAGAGDLDQLIERNVASSGDPDGWQSWVAAEQSSGVVSGLALRGTPPAPAHRPVDGGSVRAAC